MKRIFLTFVLLFAFGASSNAQENKVTEAEKLAKAEVNALVKVITLDSSIENSFLDLLRYKHEALAKAITTEEKTEIYNTIESKIVNSLTPEQLTILKSKPELFEDLIK